MVHTVASCLKPIVVPVLVLGRARCAVDESLQSLKEEVSGGWRQ